MTKQLIFETVHGSHLYGLAHAGSDRDTYRVYEGAGTDLRQSIHDGDDVVTGDLNAFLWRAVSGSHQSCEALFSPVKVFAPEMEFKWRPFLDAFRVTGGEVFAKYERTIKKFSYGDFKRRRHAARLYLNLRALREAGRFNPTLNEEEVQFVNNIANAYSGDDLRGYLLG